VIADYETITLNQKACIIDIFVIYADLATQKPSAQIQLDLRQVAPVATCLPTPPAIQFNVQLSHVYSCENESVYVNLKTYSEFCQAFLF
jgi:hypothetical protein